MSLGQCSLFSLDLNRGPWWCTKGMKHQGLDTLNCIALSCWCWHSGSFQLEDMSHGRCSLFSLDLNRGPWWCKKGTKHQGLDTLNCIALSCWCWHSGSFQLEDMSHGQCSLFSLDLNRGPWWCKKGTKHQGLDTLNCTVFSCWCKR
jgi:hypothetical protein